MTPEERITLIQTRLSQALAPTFLEVIDEGAQHVGHAHEGAGHFAVRIASPIFRGKSLVDNHRMIYSALGNAMHTEIHALRIEIKND